jgi:hypothetical protein
MRTLLAFLIAVILPLFSKGSEGPRAMDGGGGLYTACGLEGLLPRHVFDQAIASAQRRGLEARVIAIADMTRPSTEQRLYIVDLRSRRLLSTTWVAHGRNSGDLRCTTVSNREGSLQTSKGLYRVGAEIVSPKHGQALLLHGLEQGVNDRAQDREIIIHGADYVSAEFIREHGRLGRSFGCPAVPRGMMPQLVQWLANDGLLYVHAD